MYTGKKFLPKLLAEHYQGTSSLLATFGYSIYNSRGHSNVEFAAGEVIEEKQRLRVVREDIVHAHSN